VKERTSAPQVVLVTGASSGIGKSCAEFLSQAGYRVYSASRRSAFPVDVRDEASVLGAVADLMSREGRIDVVVNNAGIAVAGAVEDTSVEEAMGQFDVNFFGVLRVCRAVLPHMREQRSGCIVNIGSIGGLVAIPYQGLYSASKFALEGLSEALRMEVRPFGIRVVLIEPGDHRTALTENRRATAASGRNPAYRNRYERAVSRMETDERNGPAPEAVARLLRRVIKLKQPRLRYTVGPLSERAVPILKRALPYQAIERLMSRYYSR
jgi:NAD(P)-dependent dehydrogenase (short-subunit alcohol dehydrogenase family)